VLFYPGIYEKIVSLAMNNKNNYIMKKLFLLGILFLFFSCKKKTEDVKTLIYPESKKSDIVDVYFGIQVPDPYRWLEETESEESKEWIRAQNELTINYLSQIPFRQKIAERLKEIWNYPKYGTPFRKGAYYYYFKNDGLQAQSVLYKLKSLDAEPEVFLDPNTLSEDGTVALGNISFNKNGTLMAYTIAGAGSDWKEILIRDVESANDLTDRLRWTKFTNIAWEGNGFYYTRYDAPQKGEELKGQNINSRVCYHQIGTDQKEDISVYADPDHPKRAFYAGTSEDESFLYIIGVDPSDNGNSLYVRKLQEANAPFITLEEGFENKFSVIDNPDDTSLLVLTNADAPKYKLLQISVINPDCRKIIIPEKEDVLNSVQIAGTFLITSYMHDAYSKAFVFELNGKLKHEIKFPVPGSLASFSGEKEDNTAFYSFSSFTYPPGIYTYNIKENKAELYKSSEINFNTDNYETKQVFYESMDGTRVPMFIVHKKGIKLNGENPTLLYGYGGFNVSLMPSFSVSNLIFLENGGVFAQANIRGGGEYGKAWHEAGTRLNKQNVFDDFIYAAKYLINQKYTSPAKLAIRGGSNGGLLVAACFIQRPDLFKVALPAVGVLDMLRYHKFTIGYHWAPDYGTSEDSAEFHALYKYSPLHNLKENVEYPATLITTADHDDRVFPAHSFKFAAALQAHHTGTNPVLIRIEEKAGHGAGKPTEKIIEEAADMWAFTFQNLGIIPGYE
jgi:prolyl oligopeptidase